MTHPFGKILLPCSVKSADGNFWPSFPTGAPAPTAPTLAAPIAISSSQINLPFSGGANFLTLTPQWSVHGANTWTSAAVVSANPAAVTGLPNPSTNYDFRIKVDGPGGTSYSNVVGATTGTSSAFYIESWDGLSNGASYIRSWAGTTPAASWAAGNGLNTPIVSSTRSVSGALSLKVPYAPTGGTFGDCEVAFDLGANYREVIWEYDEWIPANYIHRSTGASPNSYNNKQFRLWPDLGGYTNGYQNSKEKIGATFLPVDGISQSSLAAEWDNGDGLNGGGMRTLGTSFGGAIVNGDLGTWVHMKWRAKAPTAKATGPGIIQCWKNNVLVINETNVDTYTAGEPHSFRYGYLMGTADSGYVAQTDFFFDNIVWTVAT